MTTASVWMLWGLLAAGPSTQDAWDDFRLASLERTRLELAESPLDARRAVLFALESRDALAWGTLRRRGLSEGELWTQAYAALEAVPSSAAVLAAKGELRLVRCEHGAARELLARALEVELLFRAHLSLLFLAERGELTNTPVELWRAARQRCESPEQRFVLLFLAQAYGSHAGRDGLAWATEEDRAFLVAEQARRKAEAERQTEPEGDLLAFYVEHLVRDLRVVPACFETERAYVSVVTSTRTPTSEDAQARALTLVTREELARRAPRSTPEALHEEPGVILQKTNHAGGAPMLRGLHGQHVLVLVDGVRLNNATTRSGPNQSLNTVDPFLVEQLEVVRGPSGVLYGSDAVAGVVNVRTVRPRFAREGTERSFLFHTVAQTADRGLSGHARAQLSTPNSAALVAVTARSFQDLSSALGPQWYTGYGEADAALKVRQRLGSRAQLAAQAQVVRQTAAPRTDRSAPGDFRMFSLQDRDFVHLRLSAEELSGLKEAEVELVGLRQAEQVDRWNLARNRQEREQVEDLTLGVRVEGELESQRVLPLETVVGVEAFFDRVRSRASRRSILEPLAFEATSELDRYPGEPTASSAAAFALFRSDSERPLSGHLGGRLQLSQVALPEDDRMARLYATASTVPPVFPAQNEGTVGVAAETGLRWQARPELAWLLNGSLGFRAPNVDDYLRLGAEGPGFTVPSRGLLPERALSVETGLRLTRPRLEGQLFASWTRVFGLVANVPTAVGSEEVAPDGRRFLARRNTDFATVWALEGELAVRPFSELTLSAHATWTRTRQQRTDLVTGAPVEEPMSKSPPVHGGARATWEPTPRSFVELSLRWAADATELSESDRGDVRICPEAPGCRGTPGFWALAFRTGLRFSKEVRGSLTLQNLTNALYRHHGSGVDEPGFSGIVSLEVQR